PTLRDLEIGVIVDLTGPRGDEAHQVERAAAERLGVAYHNFSLNGSGTGEVHEYVGAIEVIAKAEAAGKRVLVHCRAGDRRTGGLVAAYLTIVRRSRGRGPCSSSSASATSPWTPRACYRYLHENLDTMQEMLIQRGVIRDVPPGPRPSEAMDRAGP